MEMTVAPGGESEGTCDCCGKRSKSIWGYIGSADRTIAVYYAQWTIDSPTDKPNLDFIVGSWGEGAVPEDRILVSLLYRPKRGGGDCMVIDAEGRRGGAGGLYQRAMRRTEVVGTPLAQDVFRMIDVVWLADPRIAAIRALDNAV